MVRHGDEEYLTPEEACSILGVTRRTLDRYVDNKRIQKYRRGIRNVFFKRNEVMQLKHDLEDFRPADDE